MKTAVMVLDAEAYHNDEIPGVEVPCLSSSIAKILDSRSPAHAHAVHPKLKGGRTKRTDTLDMGTALHSMLLGAGREIRKLDVDDYKTKLAREARDQARADGAIPLKAAQFHDLAKSAGVLRQRMRDINFDLSGDVEQTVLWVEEADDGTPVQCKAMFDLVQWDTGRIRDLKSCESAHPDAIARAVEDYGYSIQDAAYRSAFGAVRPILRGREDVCFLFLEREEPHAVTPAWLDGTFRRIGEGRWRRAVNTWARCLKSGVWPDYGTCHVSPPPWVMRREEEREMAEAEAAEKGKAA